MDCVGRGAHFLLLLKQWVLILFLCVYQLSLHAQCWTFKASSYRIWLLWSDSKVGLNWMRLVLLTKNVTSQKNIVSFNVYNPFRMANSKCVILVSKFYLNFHAKLHMLFNFFIYIFQRIFPQTWSPKNFEKKVENLIFLYKICNLSQYYPRYANINLSKTNTKHLSYSRVQCPMSYIPII